MNHPNRYRRRRGFAVVNTVLIVLVFGIAFLGYAAYVNNQMSNAKRSRSGYSALLLAEAGLDAATQKIKANQTFTGETVTITHATSGTFGSYTTTASAISATDFRVNSTGTYIDGTVRKMAGIVQVSKRNIGSAAIMANGNVTVTGTPVIDTSPANLHVADILSNGNITVGGSSVVDGHLMAVGSVTATSSSNQGVVTGMDPLEFPDAVTTDQWQSDWITQAQAGGTIGGINNQNTVINGSKYINGNIKLVSSKSVTLKGPGVVYVKGNVELGAQCTLTNGCTLIVEGNFSQNGQAIYKIDTTITSPTPSLFIYGNKTADPTLTTCTLMGGSSSDSQGIVFVLYGKLAVGGNSTFTGAFLVAQGACDVQVVGTYTHHFPVGYTPAVSMPNLVGLKYAIEL